jgi:DNA-binding beta-propeller fold protein YncE
MKTSCCIGLAVVCFAVTILACKHKAPEVYAPSSGNYPEAVSAIFVNKCATAGCHNQASHDNAGGLLLDSWEHLFEGGNNGAVIVPYSTDYSPLLYFINTDSTLGPVAQPTMPLNHPPLSREEYLTIRNWVAAGAPDRNGNIPFADNAAQRQKIYFIHQVCDILGVVDAEKNVVMRYIPVGDKPYPEALIHTRTSKDGRYVYACFWYSNKINKIDAATDRVVATFTLNNSFWSSMEISDDGEKIALINYDNFDLAVINTNTGQTTYHNNTGMIRPTGLAANSSFDTFYISSQYGNTLYKFTNTIAKTVSIDGNTLTQTSGTGPDPYSITMSPDRSRYFVACEKTNEVRVFDRTNDALVKVLNVGANPRNLTVASGKPYVFVTCMEDANVPAHSKGAVYIFDYNTLELVKRIDGKLYQPHSVAVNEKNNTFYIFSRNQNYDGPAPHHQGPCSGRNGFYTIYDLNTFQPVNDRRYEVLVDPYVSDIRFK